MKLKRYKRLFLCNLYSSITAILFLFISYAITNIGVSFSGETEIIEQSNHYLGGLLSKNHPIPDSLLFVNICYDKQLAEICDEDGFPLGHIDITNRESLLRFLDILAQRNDYKYVILDIFFKEGMTTEYDSALYARIASMERITIPAVRGSQLACEEIIGKKAFLSDYTTTFFSSEYHKFEIGNKDQKSVPYHIYNTVTGNKHTSWGILHFDNGELCNRALFAYPHIIPDGLYANDGSRNYYNLGCDLLIDEEALLHDKLLSGKYIFIGDMMLNDQHETVAGDMAGVVIVANALISFLERQHVIPLTVILTLYILYFIFAYQIFSYNSSFARLVKWRSKKKANKHHFLCLALSWCTYSFTLSVVCLIFYYTYGVAYDILLTSTLLQILDYTVTHHTQIKNYLSIGTKKKNKKPIVE